MMRNVLIGGSLAALIVALTFAGTTGGMKVWQNMKPEPVGPDPVVVAIEKMGQNLDNRLTALSLKVNRPAPLQRFDPIERIIGRFDKPKIVEAPKAEMHNASISPPAAPPAAPVAQAPAKAPSATGGGSVALRAGQAVTVTCSPPVTTYTAPATCSAPTYTLAQYPAYTTTSPPTAYYGYPAYTTAPTASCAAPTYSTYSYSSPRRSYYQSNAPVQVAPAATYTRSYRGLFGASTQTYSSPSYNYGYGYRSGGYRSGGYRSGGYCGPFGCTY